jgi:putative SOS response-associated peptidase YedK
MRTNELVLPLHGRIPAILKREDENRWFAGFTINKVNPENQRMKARLS